MSKLATGNCSCLHGTAWVDAAGQCICLNDDLQPIPPIKMQNTLADPNPIATRFQKRMAASLAANNQTAPECAKIAGQAPPGYHYIFTNGQCVLAVNYDSNLQTFGNGAGNPISNALSGITDNAFFQNNKGLLLIGAVLGGGYLLMKGGAKPKSRVVESTTRY